MNTPYYREPTQYAMCRVCDKEITKIEKMVTWYSSRNRGQHIHICVPCVRLLYNMTLTSEETHGSS